MTERSVQAITSLHGLLESLETDAPGITEKVQEKLRVQEVTRPLRRQLRDLREQKDISQKQLAEKLGMSQAAVSKFEVGTGKLLLETVIKYAAALGEELQISVPPKETEEINAKNDRVYIAPIINYYPLDHNEQKSSDLKKLLPELEIPKETYINYVLFSRLAENKHRTSAALTRGLPASAVDQDILANKWYQDFISEAKKAANKKTSRRTWSSRHKEYRASHPTKKSQPDAQLNALLEENTQLRELIQKLTGKSLPAHSTSLLVQLNALMYAPEE